MQLREIGLLLVVAVMVIGALALAPSSVDPRPANTAEWTSWELAFHTDGEEAKVYAVRPMDVPALQFGDLVQVCVANSVYHCHEDPPQFLQPGPWSLTQVVVDRTVMFGDSYGFHPISVPPQMLIWVRGKIVKRQLPMPPVALRVVLGSAYGWSKPEDTWTVRWE